MVVTRTRTPKAERIPNAGRGVSVPDRGFGSMDPAKQREIASKGGKRAHKIGAAHQWTPAEARAAGQKGGLASHRRRQQVALEQREAQAQSFDADAQQLADAAGEGMITNHDN